MPHEANRSYRDVLRNRHVAGLLLGDLLANAGTGMIVFDPGLFRHYVGVVELAPVLLP